MKLVSQRFLLTVLLLFCWVAVFPQDCPCGIALGDDGLPPPPGLGECLPCPIPIDESVMVLVVIALVFGLYIVYKNNLKEKNPI